MFSGNQSEEFPDVGYILELEDMEILPIPVLGKILRITTHWREARREDL